MASNKLELSVRDRVYPYYRSIRNELRVLRRIGGRRYVNRRLLAFSCRHRLSRFFLAQPTAIHIEVTTRCNLNCMQCARRGDFAEMVDLNRDMALNDFRIILDQFPYLETAAFSGLGDPMLYPHIFEAIEAAKRRGLNVFLSTNGVLLRDQAIVERLVASGVNDLQISWDAARPETLQSIQGIKGFTTMVEGLKALVGMKPDSMRVYMNLVLMEENFRELTEYVELAHHVGTGRVTLNRRNYAEFKVEPVDKDAFYVSKELADELTRAREKAAELGINLIYDRNPKCDSLWNIVVITVDGLVLPCYGKSISKLFNLGNLLSEGYEKVRSSQQLRDLRKAVSAGEIVDYCHNCYLSGY